ncbi:MAG: hypothetical protein CSA20_07085 [Deltaproteobacteria bacterium]|nr:MAG: hypothetical protein CSA20_07085 [Deltaproteobacteria bacterium]
MLIVCNGCGKRYRLKDNIVPANIERLRCRQCQGTVRLEEKNEPFFFDRDRALHGLPRENVITFTNQKGGVAKTTTCLNLGLSLSILEKKVLLIDFDAQANLSLSLGCGRHSSFFECIDSRTNDFSAHIIATRYKGLFILPSNENMALLNKKYFGKKYFEFLLRDRLNLLKDAFDYILIDTPPSIEFFTLNALTSARMAVIPCPCEFLATDGVKKTRKLINLIQARSNPELEFRVLITMYNEKETVSRVMYTKLQKLYRGHIFKTTIFSDSKIKESQIVSLPALAYDRKSLAGLQHIELANEMIELMPAAGGPAPVS